MTTDERLDQLLSQDGQAWRDANTDAARVDDYWPSRPPRVRPGALLVAACARSTAARA